MRSPELADVIQAGIDLALGDLHTAMPGIVRKYDAATQLAQVQPTVKRRYTKDDGTETTSPFPPIDNVPMVFPRSGKAFISFPVKVGDYCLLVFSERSIDQWLDDKKDATSLVDPIITLGHQLTDAFAIAGVAPKPMALSNAHAQHIVVGFDDGTARAYFKQGEIALGAETPSEFVALATKCAAEFTKIQTALTAISAVLTAPPPGTPVVTLAPPLGVYTPASVAATKVKAE